MKNLELDSALMVELKETELMEINGGFWGIVIKAMVVDVLLNFEEAKRGFLDGYHGKPYNPKNN